MIGDEFSDDEFNAEEVEPFEERIDRLVAAAAMAGVQVAVPSPECCRSCACADIDLDPVHLWVFQSDGSMNDATFWQRSVETRRSPQTTGHIYYQFDEHADVAFAVFVDRVTAALEQHGFSVNPPTTSARAFEVADA